MVKRFLAILIVLTVSVTPLYAGSQKTMVNLRGEEVSVPMDVPSKERFVFQRLISVDGRLIVTGAPRPAKTTNGASRDVAMPAADPGNNRPLALLAVR